MGIHDYISRNERTYHYRIKTVLELKGNDHALGTIERAIMKYQPVRMAEPRKLMFQRNPQDFPSIENAEISVLDVELSLPASAAVMIRELAEALHIPVSFIVVRGDNDPIENEVQANTAKAEMDEEAEKAGETKAALLDIPNYDEATEIPAADLYGDKYNRRLLGYLKKVEAERAPKVVDAPNNPFDWLKMPKSDVEADAGPTVGTEDGDVAGAAEDMISSHGNLDDARKPYTRAYARKGKTYVKSGALDPVRKD